MVSVPVRELVPVLAATVKATLPLPVRLLPPVKVIQLALLATVHAHALVVVTVVLPVPPAATTLCDVGDRLKLQLPACDTVKVCPAMVSVPVRELVPVLAATVKATLPLPVRLLPPVKVIQLALLATVHAHALVVVTVVLPVPPAAATLCDVGDNAKLHVAGVNENVFDSALLAIPPGPTAATSAT